MLSDPLLLSIITRLVAISLTEIRILCTELFTGIMNSMSLNVQQKCVNVYDETV